MIPTTQLTEMMLMRNECPYGSAACPKVEEVDEKVDRLTHNQIKLMRTVYYIAGIVSISLGINVVIA